MKKKIIAQVKKRKPNILASEDKSTEVKFEYSTYTLLTLATNLKIDEQVLKQLVEKGTGYPYNGEIVITEEIWLPIKEFVINKIELIQRHTRAKNAKNIKTGFKSHSKKKKRKMGGGKPSPYFIFGNLYKPISTPMGS